MKQRKLREFSGKKLKWTGATFKHNTKVKNDQCIVVIPLCSETPSKNEYASFLRLISILYGNYEIVLLHGKSLNISKYKIPGVYLSEVICDDIFLSSRACYSDMMEFSEFYEIFKDYKYLLIYQLDAWIFKDNIKYFIDLDYDYIGSIHTYTGSLKPRVGNGGFSLRKISSFIKVCKTENVLIPFAYPEDLAFSDILSTKLKIAPISDGLKFGFQNSPSRFFKENGNNLPMGCHKFEKCEFEWWKKYINIDETIKYSIYAKDAALFKRAEAWTTQKGVNLKDPKTICDKLGWLKIFDCSPLKTLCADKIGIHEYCKEKLGKDICVPILKVYDKPEDINFNELPKQFVLKCNHGSGYNIIVRDKNNENRLDDIKKLKEWLSKDYALDYWYEMHYHYINKKCYAEEYLGDGINDIPDYKILCCNGEPIMIQVISDRFHKATKHANIYTPDWKWWDIGWHTYKADSSKPDKKPENLNEMLSYAKKLSEDFKFVRVDFYTLNGKLYLGELTFVPDAGFMRCKTRKIEEEIGNMLNINKTPGKKNKKVVYTCITGNYDEITQLSVKNNDFDYVCYTDRQITSKFWEIRQIPEKLKKLDNKRINRYVKLHPHEFFPEYDLSIYIDGNVDIKKDLNKFITENCDKKNGVIFVGEHPVRKCIYKEAKEVVALKKDEPSRVKHQTERYKKEGFPENYGLSQNCIIIRYHNDSGCVRLMNAWWEEVSKESYRDQLSLYYVLWKNKDVKCHLLSKNIFTGPVFVWGKRHKSGKITVTNNTKPSLADIKTKLKTQQPQKSVSVKPVLKTKTVTKPKKSPKVGFGKKNNPGDTYGEEVHKEVHTSALERLKKRRALKKTSNYNRLYDVM